MMLADAILTNYPPIRIGCPVQVAESFYLPFDRGEGGIRLKHISRADALHRLNVNAQLARAALQFQPLKRISIERPDGTKQHMFLPEFL